MLLWNLNLEVDDAGDPIVTANLSNNIVRSYAELIRPYIVAFLTLTGLA